MTSREILARNVRLLRSRLGLSQETLADRAGLDRTYISGVERGKYSVGIDRLDCLAGALGVEPFALIATVTAGVD